MGQIRKVWVITRRFLGETHIIGLRTSHEKAVDCANKWMITHRPHLGFTWREPPEGEVASCCFRPDEVIYLKHMIIE